jgi:hypothetical protein
VLDEETGPVDKKYNAFIRRIKLFLVVNQFVSLHIPFSFTFNRAVPQLRRLVAGFPYLRPRFNPRSGRVGFVVDKVTLGHNVSEYFSFPYYF